MHVKFLSLNHKNTLEELVQQTCTAVFSDRHKVRYIRDMVRV